MITVEDFDKMLAIARKHGVNRLTTPEITVEFGPIPDMQPVMPRKVEIGTEAAPTEEQLLFWSTGLAPDHVAEPPE